MRQKRTRHVAGSRGNAPFTMHCHLLSEITLSLRFGICEAEICSGSFCIRETRGSVAIGIRETRSSVDIGIRETETPKGFFGA